MSHPGHYDLICKTCLKRVGGCRCISVGKREEYIDCPLRVGGECENEKMVRTENHKNDGATFIK